MRPEEVPDALVYRVLDQYRRTSEEQVRGILAIALTPTNPRDAYMVEDHAARLRDDVRREAKLLGPDPPHGPLSLTDHPPQLQLTRSEATFASGRESAVLYVHVGPLHLATLELEGDAVRAVYLIDHDLGFKRAKLLWKETP